MKGTTIKYRPKRGKPTFGYSFFAGRDADGKRIQIVKRGFAREKDAEEGCRMAIAEYGKAPAPTDDSVRTLNDLFDEWMLKHVSAHRRGLPGTGWICTATARWFTTAADHAQLRP